MSIKGIDVVQLEDKTMKIAKHVSIVCAAVAIVLVCSGGWIAAKGPPVANFPGFIPLDIAKTGDVAIDKVGNVYVNVTTTGGFVKVWKYSPAGVGPEEVADIGPGLAYGLAIRANGEIYAAKRTSSTGNSLVYRVGPDGIEVPLPGTEDIVWANSLAFDRRGNPYITESYSLSPSGFGPGGIWRVPPRGEAEVWLQDDLLTGVGAAPTGANGIAFYHGDLYVVNSNKNLIVRVRVCPDGSPGQPEVWATLQEVPESPEELRSALPLMGDGLAFDVDGNAYITMVTRASIVRIDAEDYSQDTVATFFDPGGPLFAPLDTPNTIGFGTGKGGRQIVYITNLGQMKAALGSPWFGAGLLKVDAGVPGLPLP